MKKTTNLATINKSLASAYLDKKGNFTALQFDKDGNENKKTITNKATAENSAILCYVSEIATMVDKAQCYHLGQIKDTVVKNFGYSGIADYCETNFRQIGDKSQISRKRAVGRFFVQMLINPDETTTYFYRDGIPYDCTISALVECLALLKDENGEKVDMKTIDNLSEDEITEIVARFVAEYIDTDIIHPCLPTKRLRAEIKALNGTTAETEKDEKEKPTEKEKHESTRLEAVKACVDRIANLLGDSEKVADSLATILEVAEATFASDTTEEPKDETNNQ